MKINIFGKNIKVTDGIRADIEKKIGKLDKYLSEEANVDVTLSVDKDSQKVEVTIPVKGNIIRAEETSTDMYTTIDLVEETIERQLVKFKKKLQGTVLSLISLTPIMTMMMKTKALKL